MLKAKVFSPLKKSVNRLLSCLAPLAKKSDFVVRKTKGFSASGFVLALMKSVITGKATFNQFATNLGHSELKSISRQAVWKRMDLSTIPFLLDTVGTALKQRWSEPLFMACAFKGRYLYELSISSAAEGRANRRRYYAMQAIDCFEKANALMQTTNQTIAPAFARISRE
jgi:hypothetical protein